VGARCATDITGFSLLGHASHIARASKVTLRISVAAVPVFAGAREALRKGSGTDGAKRNREYLVDLVNRRAVSDEDFAILTDPQTSGGLLVAVAPNKVASYLSRVPGSVEIGGVEKTGERAIELE